MGFPSPGHASSIWNSFENFVEAGEECAKPFNSGYRTQILDTFFSDTSWKHLVPICTRGPVPVTWEQVTFYGCNVKVVFVKYICAWAGSVISILSSVCTSTSDENYTLSRSVGKPFEKVYFGVWRNCSIRLSFYCLSTGITATICYKLCRISLGTCN